MDELDQPSGFQTTIDKDNYNGALLDDEQDINCEPSETDILAKYQERHHNRRLKNSNNYQHQRPTKRVHGELINNVNQQQSLQSHPSCFRESLYILFAWLGYFVHICCALIPYQWFGGKESTTSFYDKYPIQIAPASWNVVQWGIQILWQGILLTYLSLIAAEHTIKMFDKRFYYAIGFANIMLVVWDICTQQESYLGRALSWLIIEFTLIYCCYILLKHIYFTYDVTKWVLPSRFRLDNIDNNRLNHHNDDIKHNDIDDNNNNNHNPPPLTINANTTASLIKETTTTSRNIKSILRIQNGGSLNNSPMSMSMARMFCFFYLLSLHTQ